MWTFTHQNGKRYTNRWILFTDRELWNWEQNTPIGQSARFVNPITRETRTVRGRHDCAMDLPDSHGFKCDPARDRCRWVLRAEDLDRVV